LQREESSENYFQFEGSIKKSVVVLRILLSMGLRIGFIADAIAGGKKVVEKRNDRHHQRGEDVFVARSLSGDLKLAFVIEQHPFHDCASFFQVK
jgi:hypothetical protein